MSDQTKAPAEDTQAGGSKAQLAFFEALGFGVAVIIRVGERLVRKASAKTLFL